MRISARNCTVFFKKCKFSDCAPYLECFIYRIFFLLFNVPDKNKCTLNNSLL